MTYGLIGENLSYSFSKRIHERLGEYTYSLLSLDSKAFKMHMRNRNFDGLNITIPYKKEVIPYCDEVSEVAAETGSVNTVYKRDGKVIGTNTDYEGFLYLLRRRGIRLANKKVLVLGNGGTSSTVQKCARDEGAREISVARRNHDFSADYDAEIIVNATPVGTYPNNGDKLIDLADFTKCTGVVDVVYNPLRTDLLLRAKEYGITYSSGLPMLVAQATAAAGCFTGKNYESENEKIIKWLTGKVQNIILIGMPGSGKTITGRWVSQRTGKTFVDLDIVVSEAAGMSIASIFERRGEAAFREMESNAAREYGKKQGLVISTGGGVVLQRENMDALTQNGTVFFLNRETTKLETVGRPLSKDIETLEKMYAVRRPLYEKYSDFVIDCLETVESNVEKLMELLN